jgi:DNA mismatch repair protein, C-terminal domain
LLSARRQTHHRCTSSCHVAETSSILAAAHLRTCVWCSYATLRCGFHTEKSKREATYVSNRWLVSCQARILVWCSFIPWCTVRVFVVLVCVPIHLHQRGVTSAACVGSTSLVRTLGRLYDLTPSHLIQIEHQNTLLGYRVGGVICSVDACESLTTAELVCFINQRLVQCPSLKKIVKETYNHVR